ncbi:hypothetical protein KKG37_01020 [Patescibacteria group bacterium]|nr:hypothetical protein [Patescibacteria group bacterium]
MKKVFDVEKKLLDLGKAVHSQCFGEAYNLRKEIVNKTNLAQLATAAGNLIAKEMGQKENGLQ